MRGLPKNIKEAAEIYKVNTDTITNRIKTKKNYEWI